MQEELNTLVLDWASQLLGKTALLECIIGWLIAEQPCPIQMLFPKSEDAENWSKKKLGPLIEFTPKLTALVDTQVSRKGIRTGYGQNTKTLKKFPGGTLQLKGVGSASNLRADTARVSIADEIDGYVKNVEGEGDPLELGEQRTEAAPNSFTILTSTPTFRHFSRIEAELAQTDLRKWHVPCPKCHQLFVIMWADIKWDKETDGQGKTVTHYPETAYIECPVCKAHLSEKDRKAMVRKGRWIATQPGIKHRRGYWLNAFVCLIPTKRGYVSWLHRWVDRFLKAHRSGNTQGFQNLVLAESYEVATEKPLPAEVLYSRREVYAEDEKGGVILPERALLLVSGCDVQGDRLEAEIMAVGLDGERWGIAYRVFRGDTSLSEVFNEYDEWIQKFYKHPSGHLLKVECACVDSSNRPTQIYAYSQRCKPRRVYAIKGKRGNNAQWVSSSAQQNRRLYTAEVDVPKQDLYSWLNRVDHGPYFQHWPLNPQCGYDLMYFKQLTSEVKRTGYYHGRSVWYFEPLDPHAANEALDCRVYAEAALVLLRPDYERILKNLAASPVNDWRSDRPVREPPPPPDPTEPLKNPQAKARQQVKPLSMPLRPRKSWFNAYG